MITFIYDIFAILKFVGAVISKTRTNSAKLSAFSDLAPRYTLKMPQKSKLRDKNNFFENKDHLFIYF